MTKMVFEFNDLKGFLFMVLLAIPSTLSTNIDCSGKPFHCLNSTHFMICVDLGGGVSTTIDDFIIPCPPTTECHEDNRFECEFPKIKEPDPPLLVIGVSKANIINASISSDDSVTTPTPIEVTTVFSSTEKSSETISPILEDITIPENTVSLNYKAVELTPKIEESVLPLLAIGVSEANNISASVSTVDSVTKPMPVEVTTVLSSTEKSRETVLPILESITTPENTKSSSYNPDEIIPLIEDSGSPFLVTDVPEANNNSASVFTAGSVTKMPIEVITVLSSTEKSIETVRPILQDITTPENTVSSNYNADAIIPKMEESGLFITAVPEANNNRASTDSVDSTTSIEVSTLPSLTKKSSETVSLILDDITTSENTVSSNYNADEIASKIEGSVPPFHVTDVPEANGNSASVFTADSVTTTTSSSSFNANEIIPKIEESGSLFLIAGVPVANNNSASVFTANSVTTTTPIKVTTVLSSTERSSESVRQILEDNTAPETTVTLNNKTDEIIIPNLKESGQSLTTDSEAKNNVNNDTTIITATSIEVTTVPSLSKNNVETVWPILEDITTPKNTVSSNYNAEELIPKIKEPSPQLLVIGVSEANISASLTSMDSVTTPMPVEVPTVLSTIEKSSETVWPILEDITTPENTVISSYNADDMIHITKKPGSPFLVTGVLEANNISASVLTADSVISTTGIEVTTGLSSTEKSSTFEHITFTENTVSSTYSAVETISKIEESAPPLLGSVLPEANNISTYFSSTSSKITITPTEMTTVSTSKEKSSETVIPTLEHITSTENTVNTTYRADERISKIKDSALPLLITIATEANNISASISTTDNGIKTTPIEMETMLPSTEKNNETFRPTLENITSTENTVSSTYTADEIISKIEESASLLASTSVPEGHNISAPLSTIESVITTTPSEESTMFSSTERNSETFRPTLENIITTTENTISSSYSAGKIVFKIEESAPSLLMTVMPEATTPIDETTGLSSTVSDTVWLTGLENVTFLDNTVSANYSESKIILNPNINTSGDKNINGEATAVASVDILVDTLVTNIPKLNDTTVFFGLLDSTSDNVTYNLSRTQNIFYNTTHNVTYDFNTIKQTEHGKEQNLMFVDNPQLNNHISSPYLITEQNYDLGKPPDNQHDFPTPATVNGIKTEAIIDAISTNEEIILEPNKKKTGNLVNINFTIETGTVAADKHDEKVTTNANEHISTRIQRPLSEEKNNNDLDYVTEIIMSKQENYSFVSTNSFIDPVIESSTLLPQSRDTFIIHNIATQGISESKKNHSQEPSTTNNTSENIEKTAKNITVQFTGNNWAMSIIPDTRLNLMENNTHENLLVNTKEAATNNSIQLKISSDVDYTTVPNHNQRDENLENLAKLDKNVGFLTMQWKDKQTNEIVTPTTNSMHFEDSKIKTVVNDNSTVTVYPIVENNFTTSISNYMITNEKRDKNITSTPNPIDENNLVTTSTNNMTNDKEIDIITDIINTLYLTDVNILQTTTSNYVLGNTNNVVTNTIIYDDDTTTSNPIDKNEATTISTTITSTDNMNNSKKEDIISIIENDYTDISANYVTNTREPGAIEANKNHDTKPKPSTILNRSTSVNTMSNNKDNDTKSTYINMNSQIKTESNSKNSLINYKRDNISSSDNFLPEYRSDKLHSVRLDQGETLSIFLNTSKDIYKGITSMIDITAAPSIDHRKYEMNNTNKTKTKSLIDVVKSTYTLPTTIADNIDVTNQDITTSMAQFKDTTNVVPNSDTEVTTLGHINSAEGGNTNASILSTTEKSVIDVFEQEAVINHISVTTENTINYTPKINQIENTIISSSTIEPSINILTTMVPNNMSGVQEKNNRGSLTITKISSLKAIKDEYATDVKNNVHINNNAGETFNNTLRSATTEATIKQNLTVMINGTPSPPIKIVSKNNKPSSLVSDVITKMTNSVIRPASTVSQEDNTLKYPIDISTSNIIQNNETENTHISQLKQIVEHKNVTNKSTLQNQTKNITLTSENSVQNIEDLDSKTTRDTLLKAFVYVDMGGDINGHEQNNSVEEKNKSPIRSIDKQFVDQIYPGLSLVIKNGTNSDIIQNLQISKNCSESGITIVNEKTSIMNSGNITISGTDRDNANDIDEATIHKVKDVNGTTADLRNHKNNTKIFQIRHTRNNSYSVFSNKTMKKIVDNQDNKNISISAFDCLNKTRGKHADSKDCRKFYICIGKLQPVEGICPNNTVFSEINKQCTRNLSHCVRNNQFHCLYEGRFSDFFKDNIYYICVKNNIQGFLRYKLQCQSGYHLNKRTLKCEENVEILNQSISSISENSKTNDANRSEVSDKSSSNIKKDFECKKEGKFPYLNDCRKYYVCYKNNKDEYRRKIRKCSSDEIFDIEKTKCVSTDSDEC